MRCCLLQILNDLFQGEKYIAELEYAPKEHDGDDGEDKRVVFDLTGNINQPHFFKFQKPIIVAKLIYYNTIYKISETEGAKFWLSVLTELKQRGVEDILIACIDGLKGFPEAIEVIFPNTCVQLCIVHQIRSSMKYVPDKEKKTVMEDLKPVYKAVNVAIILRKKFSKKPIYPSTSFISNR